LTARYLKILCIDSNNNGNVYLGWRFLHKVAVIAAYGIGAPIPILGWLLPSVGGLVSTRILAMAGLAAIGAASSAAHYTRL
jgi:hypothetical protein